MQENENQREKIEAGLSLGSNEGDRLAYLRNAVKAISDTKELRITGLSPIYETEPVGVKPEYQDMPYLNAVVIVETFLTPDKLSRIIHEIESRQGRIRTDDRFAPRTIDIDILYAGNTICEEPDLTLPHPRWAQRRFVLQPLADLRPTLRIPGSTQTVAALLAAMPAGSEAVRRIPEGLTA
jgi:2-amino-4-hydroxy-6-hydroxymethyldihydropteridine diphosphokinase